MWWKRVPELMLAVVLLTACSACEGEYTKETAVYYADPSAMQAGSAYNALRTEDSGVDDPSPTPEATRAPLVLTRNDQEPASAEDMRVGGLEPGTPYYDAVALFGEAQFLETQDADAEGYTLMITTYSKGNRITYIGDSEDYYEVLNAEIVDPGAEGPRGLRVGSSAEEVVAAFSVELPELAQETASIRLLYGEPNDEADGAAPIERIAPPCGYVKERHDDGEIVYRFFLTPDEEISAEENGQSDAPERVSQAALGSVRFALQDGVVLSIGFSSDAGE